MKSYIIAYADLAPVNFPPPGLASFHTSPVKNIDIDTDIDKGYNVSTVLTLVIDCLPLLVSAK